MSKDFYKKIFLFLFVLTLFVPAIVPVFAQSGTFTPTALVPCDGPDCNFGSLVLLAKGVAAKIFILGLALAPIIFAYAGFLMVTSQDSPAKRATAKKIFWNVAIGLVVMMCAWVFVNLILTALLCGNITSASWFPFAVSGGGGTCPTP